MEKNKANRQLSLPRQLGYGIGQTSGGIIYAVGVTFLLVYYTDVAHINPALASIIIAVSKILDGFSDLLMGWLIDRTKSRFGKARPWLLRIAIPSAVCLVALFSVPENMGSLSQILYVFITYNLLSTVCFTVIGVAYNSLNSFITTNQYERGINSVLGMTFYTIALLVINVKMLDLCKFFGNGDVYSRKGWSLAVAVLGIIMTICLFITFFSTKELDVAASQGKKQSKGHVLKSLKALISNKYWVEYVIAYLAMGICNGMIMSSAVYYTGAIIGDRALYSSLSAALYIAMFLGIIVSGILIKKLGKRNTAILGLVLMLIGTVLTGVLPPTLGNAMLCMALRGLGVGFPSALGAAVLQDTLTYGKWKSGFDMVGIGNAACSFTSKLAGSVSTVFIGWFLNWSGYDETVVVQSTTTNQAIITLFVWLPLVFLVIAIICFWAYKLDKEYDIYLKDLNEGRYAPGVVSEEE